MTTAEALPTSDHLRKLAIEATKEVGTILMTSEITAKTKKAAVKKLVAAKITWKMLATKTSTKEVKKELLPLKIVQKPKTTSTIKPVKPVVTKTVAKKVNGYYKVQAGLFASRSSADRLAEKLQAAGFETYVKKLTSGWRVQAGAFKTKAQADRLKASLRAHGFQSKVIYE
jgi:cell division protein FtsN